MAIYIFLVAVPISDLGISEKINWNSYLSKHETDFLLTSYKRMILFLAEREQLRDMFSFAKNKMGGFKDQTAYDFASLRQG